MSFFMNKAQQSEHHKVRGDHVKSVVFMRGIPSSMKTTFAKALVDLLRTYNLVSKDEIRGMMFGTRRYKMLTLDDLKAIERVRDAMMLEILSQGRSVVLDETFIEIDDIERAFQIIPRDVNKDIFDLTWVPFEWSFNLDRIREEPRGFDTLLDARERLSRNPLSNLSEPFDFDFCNDYMRHAVEEKYHEIQERAHRNESSSVSQGSRTPY